jgi:4-hydroxy-4-methyl-2-oxoglutarate aldolase
VIDYRCPIDIGGVKINPGDLIFADKEGVLVIPGPVEEKCIALALQKAEAEDGFAAAVKGGMSVVEAFAKFGVM